MGLGHPHAGGRHRWRLALSFALIAGFFVVELVTALVSGSLALVSDAGHMAADVVALGAALLATRVATRHDTTGRRTYGSYRVEVFASLLAVLLMLVVAGSVVVESTRRIGGDPEVAVGPMVVVGGLCLLVNLVALLLLLGGAAESLNVKGAYLEVVADTAGSVGVLVAAGLITWTGEVRWDVVVALAIGRAAGPIRNRARHLAGGAPLAHRLPGDRLVMPGADDHETVCSCAAGRRTSRVSVKVSTSLPDWSIARPTRWSS